METERILTKTNRTSFSKPSGAKDQAKNPLAKEATLLTLYVLLVLHTYIYVTIHLESFMCLSLVLSTFSTKHILCIYLYAAAKTQNSSVERCYTTRKRHSVFAGESSSQKVICVEGGQA